MTAPLESWKVLLHGPSTEVDDNAWRATGTIRMPVRESQRRMTVVRLHDEPIVEDPRAELRRLADPLR